MITIHSVTHDGHIRKRSWDNRTCDFFDESGEKISVEVDIPKNEKKKIMDDYQGNCGCGCEAGDERYMAAAAAYFERARYGKTTLTKSRNLASLRIQMGMKCNYSCQYCKQASHGKYDAQTDLADAKKFIRNFDAICTTNRDEPINIQLWGGEPLLYWPVMTLLGEFLRGEFPRARITCLSNGSLMTRKKADWFLRKQCDSCCFA